MITLKKLDSLREDTRMRKIIRILESASRGESYEGEYITALLERIVESSENRVSEETRGRAARLLPSPVYEKQSLNDLSYALASDMGAAFGDWDFLDADDHLDRTRRTEFPISLLLDRIRSPFNVGSMFRSAESFGVSNIYLMKPGAAPDHPRTLRSAAGAVDVIPHISGESDEILELVRNRPLFALEVGGVDIRSFDFPADGVMIVGSEELGVSPEMLSLARSSAGIVSIPLYGAKGSLNVSTSCAIALHEWVSRLRA